VRGIGWQVRGCRAQGPCTLSQVLRYLGRTAIVLAIASIAGPSVAGVNEWTKTGPFGANVRTVVIHPTTPSEALVATANGVFRTVDGGLSWSASSDGMGRLFVKALVIHPADPDRLFAATADDGLYRSLDRGGSWAPFGTGLPADLQSLAIARTDPTVLYAGTSWDSLFKSIDGGITWHLANAGLPAGRAVFLIEVDPSDPSTVYAYLWGGLYKSTDGGTTWLQLAMSQVISVLRVDPLQTNVLYAGTRLNGLWKSTNGGNTWSGPISGLGSGGVRGLALDPVDPGVLYAGTVDGAIFKSVDSAVTWFPVEAGTFATTVTAISVAPSASAVVLAGFRGSGLLQTTDGGAMWFPSITGLSDVDMKRISVAPGDPSTVYGLHITGVWRSSDGSVSWARANGDLPVPVIGKDLVTDPTDPNVAYVMVAWPYKTVDGGVHWQKLDNGIFNGSGPIAIHPTDSTTLFAAPLMAGVYKTTDGGASWLYSGSGLNHLDVIRDFSFSRADPSVVYAAADGSILMYRTTDGGASWSRADGGLAWNDSMRVAADSADPDLSYAVGQEFDPLVTFLYKTSDGGAVWGSVDPWAGDTQVISVLTHPLRAAALFAGTESSGVYMSLDAAGSWFDLNLGAMPPRVRDLAFDTMTGTLFAAASDGIWALTFEPPVIEACPLGTAVLGVAYDATVTATHGVAPYTWTLLDGALPPGLTLDSGSGSISGIPTGEGEFPFAVGVTDSIYQVSELSCSLVVAPPLGIATTTLPSGVLGRHYAAVLEPSGGLEPYAWLVESGALPPGLWLDPEAGSITGTPFEAGSYSFTIKVSDGSGQVATEEFALDVSALAEPIPALGGPAVAVLILALAVIGFSRSRRAPPF